MSKRQRFILTRRLMLLVANPIFMENIVAESAILLTPSFGIRYRKVLYTYKRGG